MLRNLIVCSFLGILAYGLAFAEEAANPRVKVDVSAQKDASGSYLVNFSVKPQSGMQLTLEAPWKLTLLENSDLSYQGAARQKEKDSKKQYIYTKAEMNDKLPGYQVKIDKQQKKASEISFTLEAFSCTKDKTRCFKDVVKETYTLKD
ncbi:MAG: hypothetical protein HRU09_18140 [Oligoflexales bacterium]|nr:hypothetical protein [Oligoflexales bacterium]